MLIKWVVCTVTDRPGFSTGQSGWGELRDLPGFLGQSGGWSRTGPDRAEIVACWQDDASYQAFMAGPHDRLAAAQSGTYDSIQVRLFEADRPPALDDRIVLEPAWTVTGTEGAAPAR